MTPADHLLIRRRQRRRTRPRSGLPAFMSLLIVPIAVAVCAGSCAVVAAARYVTGVSSDYMSAEEAIAARGGGARIYDRNGTLLFQFLDERYGQQERVSLDQMSFWLQAATIAAEDASFYSNPGISVRGISARGVREPAPRRRVPEGQRRQFDHPAAREADLLHPRGARATQHRAQGQGGRARHPHDATSTRRTRSSSGT